MTKHILFLFGAAAALVLGAAPGHAQPAPAETVAEAPAWQGVFVAEKRFGPDLAGPVSLSRTEAGWVARIQGDSVPVTRRDAPDGAADWTFDFFGQGRFVGRQAGAAAPIRGHWIQPPGVVQSQGYATPVRLEPFDGGAGYQGMIAPFVQEATLNIPLIAEPGAPAGRYRTFLRDPERNLGMWFGITAAEVDGDEIRFLAADGTLLATGHSVEPGRRFSMRFPRFGETLDFTRRARDAAPTFYPRRSAAAPVLTRPAALADGWRTGAPASTGLDSGLLTNLVASIAGSEPAGLREPTIHALLVAHRGTLVVEEYFHGFDRERPHDSRSAGKSITSALLGIALREKMFAGLDTPVYPLFGGTDRFANPDSRKAQLTLRHLVSMSPGLDCRDGNADSPGDEDRMQSQDLEADWYRFALDLPMVSAPGDASFYCTAGMNLIGGAIRQASGVSLLRFFQERFADPLDIAYYQFNLSPTGDAYLGGGVRLRPRDFLKLGQVYLGGGIWNGKRLVSADWVRQSAAAHGSIGAKDNYGLGWWRQTFEVRGRAIETFYASGNGGQMLFVVPSLDMTVMIHAGNYSDVRTRNAFRDRFMTDYILPAAIASK